MVKKASDYGIFCFYYKNILLRPSCYRIKDDKYITACKYAGTSRVSDITIGDFWGIQNETALFKNADLGISLCMINTQNGNRLFESIKQNVLWQIRDISEALAKQPHLSCNEAGVQMKAVETARRMYAKKGFRYIASKYGENGVCGLYPKGVRFIQCAKKRVLKKMGFGTDRSRKS